MSSSERKPGAPGPSRSRMLVMEAAVVASGLLLVPFLTNPDQTTTMYGMTIPTVIVVVVFWILGVIGGGVFTFRNR